MKNCLVCERISQIKNNTNPNFVCELKTGFVVLADYQFYKGYTIFISKRHVYELHKLGKIKNEFLKEMSLVAEAVYNLFKPNKLNYELLGNTDRHLHWHIIPRYPNDPKPEGPIWYIDKEIRMNENTKLKPDELKKLTRSLKSSIKNIYNF